MLDCGGYSDNAAVRSREDWELYLHLAACGRKVVFVPLVFGFYHDLPGSMIKETARTESDQAAHVTRVFDQLRRPRRPAAQHPPPPLPPGRGVPFEGATGPVDKGEATPVTTTQQPAPTPAAYATVRELRRARSRNT